MSLLTRLIFILFCFSSLNAQNYLSKQYTTAEGLPNNAIRSLYIDHQSDLWIGSENGISKLENGQFTIVPLPKTYNQSCWDILEDPHHTMWFASYGGGVYSYDGKKFSAFTHKQGLPSNRTRKLLAYHNQMIMGTELGVALIDLKTHKISVPKGIEPHSGVFIITDFFVHKDEVYFSALNEGIYKLVFDTSGTARIQKVLQHQIIYSMGWFDQLYCSNKGVINKYDWNAVLQNKEVNNTFGQSVVWDYTKGPQGIIYAAAWGIFDSSGGLYRIENNRMMEVSTEFGITSKSLLNVVYNPKNKRMYVGSKDQGIYEINFDSAIQYKTFQANSTIDFEEINESKVILHQQGLSYLNSDQTVRNSISSKKFKDFQIQYLSNHKVPAHAEGYYELNASLNPNELEYYEVVKNQNTLWISTNIGIFQANANGQLLAYLPIHSYKIGFTTNGTLIETIPYAGVRVCKDAFDLKGKHFSEFDSNTPKDIVGIVNSDTKTYLISVFDGLFEYNGVQFHSILKSGLWKERKLKFISKDYNGRLIIATEFGAVYIIDPNNHFKTIGIIPKEKIIGNTITFLEYYKGTILIGTEKGITAYTKGNIRFIDQEQGLRDCAIQSSHLFGSTLFLGTKKGYYCIDLDQQLGKHSTISSLSIRDLSINSQPISKDHYQWFSYDQTVLKCDYQHNTIAFQIVPKGAKFPNKLRYRYRLQSSNRWTPFTDKPTIYLSYLPDNTYPLEVEILDLNTGITSLFHPLTIIITPPFWNTWWFTVILILIGIIGVFVIIYRIHLKAKNKAATDQLIAQEKLKALLSQMNPHFTFNAMNAIQQFVFNNDEHKSTQYISEFASLMRQTLNNSSKLSISLEDEIAYLEKYISIENMRFGNRIQYRIIIDKDIDEVFTEIPTMLLQPFVENIFIHAFEDSQSDPFFSINFSLINPNLLECTIKDNGKRTKTKTTTHHSKGIAIATERIRLLQPKNTSPIHIDFSEQGTTVSIRLFID